MPDEDFVLPFDWLDDESPGLQEAPRSAEAVGLPLPEGLRAAAEESLDKEIEIIRIPTKRAHYSDDQTWLKAVDRVHNAVAEILKLQARTDEGSLRVREFKLGELMQLIAEEERGCGRPLAQMELLSGGRAVKIRRIPYQTGPRQGPERRKS